MRIPALSPRRKWLLLLAAVVILFFWKILFTHQFSPFLIHDNACAYAWNHFAASTLKQGVLPLWDPYSHTGRPFLGEMQTALFYPLKTILYLWPLNRSGLFSLQLFHEYFVFAHVLGAFFMFLLAEELGLSGFAAFVSALCFSLGGFVGRVGWPYMLDSAIWLPLILLFQIRALRSADIRNGVMNACAAGLAFGMAILAGSIHVAMMDAVVVASAGIYFALQRDDAPEGGPAARFGWAWGLSVMAVIGVVAFCAGAVQLFPSLEYSDLSLRYRLTGLAPLASTQKIPYDEIRESFQPYSILSFLFGGMPAGALAFSPYFGVFPLLLAIVGIRQQWRHGPVRYLTWLAALAFFYTLGLFSALHGLAYAFVPYLWMSWQAGRFIYLTHFAAALLAGFGVKALFSSGADSLAGMARVLKWAVIASAVALAAPALAAKPQPDQWIYFSVMLLACGYGLLLYVRGTHSARAAQFLVVALIFCDLSAFNWTISNKNDERKAGRDRLEDLLGTRGVAGFLKSRPGLFRVHIEGEDAPSIGNLYGIQTTDGRSATVLKDLEWFWQTPRMLDLMSVRYHVLPRTLEGATPVFEDGKWRVYENRGLLPRAWTVREVHPATSRQEMQRRMSEAAFDPLREAFLEGPLPAELHGVASTAPAERVQFELYQADRLELRVHSPGGMLVLSEVFYPGWRATVNGEPAAIHKVNGLFRGVVVPAGESRVAFRYAPRSVLAGAVVSLLAFSGTFIFAAASRRHDRLRRPPGAKAPGRRPAEERKVMGAG